MNPLKLPWSKRPVKVEVEKAPNEPYLGLRNTKVRESRDLKQYLVVAVSGISSIPAGPYKVEYSEGATLRWYMRQLRMLHAASYAAVRDVTYPDRGRCRLTYIPKQDSRITISSARISSAMRMQRSVHDPKQLARNMGRTGKGTPPKSVTKKIR